MKFLPKKPQPGRLSFIFRSIRFILLIINRIGGSLILFGVALFFLTYLHKSPTAFLRPPEATVVRSTRDRIDEAQQCGCIHAESCNTIVPVGSFRREEFSDEFAVNLSSSELEREKRRRVVRSMAMDAWDAYTEHAWGFDELQPVSKAGDNALGGVGATIVEAVGTLYIMNLTSRYDQAREWIKSNLDFEQNPNFLSVYQTTNRILGSLMSAYQLTGDELFMEKAEDLGKRLSITFNSVNGVPYPQCHLGGPNRNLSGLPAEANSAIEEGFLCYGETTTQSEAGGLSLEFRALAFHSLTPYIRNLRCKVDRAVQAVIESGPPLLQQYVAEELEKPGDARERDGESGVIGAKANAASPFSYMATASSYYAYVVQVWHSAVSAVGGGPAVDTAATFSRPARAFYEYLAKAWRQGGGCEPYLRFPLDAAMHMLLRRAIHESPTHDLYLRSFDGVAGEADDAAVDQSMCYLPALFHTAARHKTVSARRLDQWLDVAEGITKSCVSMYDRFPGFLGGDSARYNGGLWITKGAFRLQADLVEAVFYMSRSTGDEKYAEIAWRILKNMDVQCKVPEGGYTVLEEKDVGTITKGDRMPSEFLGATLKFLYLTFSDPSVLPLQHYVFNRAGHPLLVTPALGAINNCHADFM